MGYAKYGEDIREQVDINLAKIAPEEYIPGILYVAQTSSCPYCDESFQTEADMFAHMRKQHNNGTGIQRHGTRLLERGEFAVAPVVLGLIGRMNDAAVKRKRPKLSQLNKDAHNFSPREMQYIYGFYEYSLACLIDDTEKDGLYFGAYNKLLPFIMTDPRALLTVKMICLRFLWIEQLSELCKISKPNEFSLVCSFFSGRSDTSQAEEKAQSDKIFEVFVEEEEYRNTQEIVNFMKREYNAVRRYLGEALPQADEGLLNANLADRIFLLQARCSEVSGELDKARYYYRKIINPYIKRQLEAANV